MLRDLIRPPRREAVGWTWIPLLTITGVGFVACAWFSSRIGWWVVMTDELQHARAAISVGEGALVPTVHGRPSASVPQLHALLTAPLYQLWDMPEAFRAVHVMNAALMASTAVPAYLLAREALPSRLGAQLVAALSIAVPWIALSLMVLTDAAAYPTFAWTVLALQRTLAAPSVARDLVAVAALAVAFSARTQFVLLALALPVVVVSHEVLFAVARAGRGGRMRAVGAGLARALLGHRAIAALAALALLAGLPALLGGSLPALLGPYAVTVTEGELLPSGLAASVAGHLAFVTVAVGILPVVLTAGWTLAELWRPSAKATHAFATLALVVVSALVVQVSSFNVRFADAGIQDRYLFYVVPLLFTGMGAFLFGPRRSLAGVAVAAAGAAWVLSKAQYVAAPGPYFSSPARAFHGVLARRAERLADLVGIEQLQATAVVVMATLLSVPMLWAAARALGRPAAATGIALLVLLFCALETGYTLDRMAFGSDNGIPGRLPAWEGRDWIDDELGRRASVGIVPSPQGTYSAQRTWWDVEFWNVAVRHSYSVDGSPTYTPFHARPLRVEFRTGAVRPQGPDTHLVVSRADTRFRLLGRTVARHGRGLELIEARRPYRAAWATTGISVADGTIVGPRTLLRVYGEAGGARLVRVSLTLMAPSNAPRGQRYGIAGRGARLRGTLGAGESRRQTVPLCVPRRGAAELRLTTPGPVPAGQPPGAPVGIRLRRVTTAASGRC